MKAAHSTSDGQTFYLYVSPRRKSILGTGSVLYKVVGEQMASKLCRLLNREYSSKSREPGFFLKSSSDVDPDDQILLDEAIAWLDLYDDPDSGVYDPPPPEELMVRAGYARRAREWEAIIVKGAGSDRGNPHEDSKPPSSNDKSNRVRRRKKHKLTARKEKILEILKKGEAHGIVYCSALELENIPPRMDWIEEGCPATYPEAYKNPKWRQRIQDEKYHLSQFLPKKRTRPSSPTSSTRRRRVNL